MRVEIRHGAPRHGIDHTEQAIVILKPLFKEEVRRLAIHRWGQGWHWEDNNQECPPKIQKALNG